MKRSVYSGTTFTSKVTFGTSTQKRNQTTEKWDVLSAVCLERHPIITKPMQDIEKRYQEMLRQIEFENSLMSDFEIRVEEEKGLKWKQMSTDNKMDTVTIQTAQDFEDLAEQELKKFQFASRITGMRYNRIMFQNYTVSLKIESLIVIV